jgi:hypothetical protein
VVSNIHPEKMKLCTLVHLRFPIANIQVRSQYLKVDPAAGRWAGRSVEEGVVVVTETQRTELKLCTVVPLDVLITDLQAAEIQSRSCGREMGGEGGRRTRRRPRRARRNTPREGVRHLGRARQGSPVGW